MIKQVIITINEKEKALASPTSLKKSEKNTSVSNGYRDPSNITFGNICSLVLLPLFYAI